MRRGIQGAKIALQPMGRDNMEILNVIAAKLNLAERVLEDLTANYRHLDDATRLEKANTILDEINSYLQIEENLLFPFMQRNGEYDDLLAKARAVHEQIEDLTEYAIMMHVDEPSGEFWKNMVKLKDLIVLARRADEEMIFPWAKVYLSERDQYYIATNMKNQMTHESLPSSGMTIY
jgi:hypothetical protein